MRFLLEVHVFLTFSSYLANGYETDSIVRGNIYGGFKNGKNATQIKSLEPGAVKVMKRLQRELYPLLEDIIFDPEISNECSSAFQKIMTGLQNFEFWAISFARSSGGLPSMLDGNAVELGNYDACLASAASNSRGETTFSGRYCTLLLNVNNPLIEKILLSAAHSQPRLMDLFYNNVDDFVEFGKTQYLRIGVCMPSTCNGGDIEYAVRKLGGDYGIEPWVLACRAKSEDPPLTIFQLCVIGVIIFLVVLCLFGSCVDAWTRHQEPTKASSPSVILGIVQCFSIQRSWDSVFNFEVKTNERYLACLHGLRAFSAIYILWFHAYVIIDPTTIQNAMEIAEWVRHGVSFLPIYQGAHAVETFFCISGAMAFRVFSKQFSKGERSVLAMIASDLIRRWIRLAIPSVAIIGLYNMMFLITSGPTKDFTEPYFWGKCVKHWWTIPTMLSNIKGADEACLLHLWYVGVDFQLRVLFLLPIIMMSSRSRYGPLGFSFAGSMAMVSIIFVTVTTFRNRILPTGIPAALFLPKIFDLYKYVQSWPIAHFGSFAIGVCTMYIIEEQRNGKIKKFSRPIIGLLWIVALIAGVANFFIPLYWQRGGDPWTANSALYAGLSRTIWSGGVGWIIYVCSMGYGGPLNWFLALRALVPVSRLSFSFYLVHVFVLEAKVIHQRGYHEARHYLQTVTALGATCVSLFCAFVFYCLVENPVSNLLDLCCGKRSSSKLLSEVRAEKGKELPERNLQPHGIIAEKCHL